MQGGGVMGPGSWKQKKKLATLLWNSEKWNNTVLCCIYCFTIKSSKIRLVVPFFHSTVNTGLQEYKLALQLQFHKLGLRFSNFRTNYVRFYSRPYLLWTPWVRSWQTQGPVRYGQSNRAGSGSSWAQSPSQHSLCPWTLSSQVSATAARPWCPARSRRWPDGSCSAWYKFN